MIFLKILKDLRSLNIFSNLYNVFQRFCKDLCNFFTDMNKIKILIDFTRFWTQKHAEIRGLETFFIPVPYH